MKSALEMFLAAALPLLATVVATGSAWVFVHLGNYLKARAVNSRAAGALAVLTDYAGAIVQDIENQEKAALLLKSTGGLTKEDGDGLKKIAIDRFKKVLGPEGLAQLEKALGVWVGGSLDALLSAKVEQAVAVVKSP